MDNLPKNIVGFINILDSTNDLNNIKKTGFYSWYTENGFPKNMPVLHSSRGLLLVLNEASHTMQMIFDSEARVVHRFGTANNFWVSWKEL